MRLQVFTYSTTLGGNPWDTEGIGFIGGIVNREATPRPQQVSALGYLEYRALLHTLRGIKGIGAGGVIVLNLRSP